FLQAGVLAVEMESAGAGHVHAAFAHGPASVAHFVHLLTDIPFSFAAHAKDLYLSSPDILARKVAASSFVLVCSSSAAEELRRVVAAHWDPAVRAHVDKIVLAPHGVDTDRFMPAPAALASADAPAGADAPLRVLAVGRLVPKKGFPVLLDALADLQRAGVDFRCRIVGGGPGRDELAGRAAQLGLGAQVTFLGALAQNEIVAQYQWADVFVQASVVTPDGDRDGIPNSVMEAMASGLAVAASAVGGIPEVVHDRTTGLVVAPGDAPALAGALRALAGDRSLRDQLGSNARAYAVEHLSRRVCIEPVARRLLAAVGLTPTPAVGAAAS
ncbi:MAG: glycosyltransferase family 4 protein, partial [Acidimicrobiales bacterium]